MKIRIPSDVESSAGDISIPKSSMLTWAGPNAMKVKTFYSAAWWHQRGFSNWILCGSGHDAKHSACIPFTIPYIGTPTRMKLRLRILVTNSRVRTFRWAFATARADSAFLGCGAAKSNVVTDQGEFTAKYHKGTEWQEFILWSENIPQSGYLYLWRTSNSYGNIHIEGATMEVYVATSASDWRSADLYVYDEGWKKATPYIAKREGDQIIWQEYS